VATQHGGVVDNFSTTLFRQFSFLSHLNPFLERKKELGLDLLLVVGGFG